MDGRDAETTTQVGQLMGFESGCAGDLHLCGRGYGLEITTNLGRGNHHLATVGAAAAAYETGDLQSLH